MKPIDDGSSFPKKPKITFILVRKIPSAMRWPWRWYGPSAAAFILLLSKTHAGTSTQTGVAGINGVNGTNNGAAWNGGHGTPGAEARATISSDAAVNTALATGGGGGHGGQGAQSTYSGRHWGGDGGWGGYGGNAIASAASSREDGDAEATATARAGAGGGGGSGGFGNTFFGTVSAVGGNGGRGGDGGSASASATAITLAGSAKAYATTFGGSFAVGGLGGAGEDGHGYPVLSLGVGGTGAPGGSGHALALGSNASADPVDVRATANGGRGGAGSPFAVTKTLGGFAGSGGTASLGTAVGTSTGGGTVTVRGTATGGNGGDGHHGGDGGGVALTDAVSGSTSGTLSLIQSATGGGGGEGMDILHGFDGTRLAGDAGKGGNAVSRLSLINSDSQVLIASCLARGGSGGQYEGSEGTMGIGGNAISQLQLSGPGEVRGIVEATGGGGEKGGKALIEPSSVVSTGFGKRATLTARQRGGSGSGAASPLENAVSGSAPGGILELTQENSGGSILILPAGNIGGGGLIAGTAGHATAVCELRNAGAVRAWASASGEVSSSIAEAVCVKAFGNVSAEASGSGTLRAKAESFGGIITRLRTAATAAARSSNDSISVSCTLGIEHLHVQNFGRTVSTQSFGLAGVPLPARSATELQGMKRLLILNYRDYLGDSTAASVTFDNSGHTGNVKLALLNGLVADPGGTLTAVHFEITLDGNPLRRQTFTNWTELSAYFTDNVVDLGGASLLHGKELTVSFTTTGGDQNTQFNASMLVAAAESPIVIWGGGFNLNGEDALPDADPDRDGLSNRMEYAFALNPANGNSLALPTGEMTEGGYVITFEQPPGVTGIIYKAEYSSNLSPETWIPVADTGTGSTHIFIVPIAALDRWFVRLNVLSP